MLDTLAGFAIVLFTLLLGGVFLIVLLPPLVIVWAVAHMALLVMGVIEQFRRHT